MRKDRKGKVDPQVRARAEELSSNGMPYQMAMAVAHGRMGLNEALEKMARRDRVTALMDRHDLSRALATQVAIGHADLDQVLARRRLEQHRSDNRDRTCLVPEQPLALVLHDGRTVRGAIAEVEPYSIRFVPESGDPEDIHKLQIKYGYNPADWKKVKKGVRQNRKVASNPEEPALRPQDRYSCSDRRLFGYLDQSVDVVATLLDGDLLRGRVRWFSRYEFGMTLRTDVELTVFRHSLKDLTAST